jgi:phosphoglycerol transferase MdoB-like AlkP superfamily enzyme
MRRNWLLSIGAVVLAFLGTQHHNLMMLLVAAGVSNAGLSLMASLPLLRDAMLLMSLLMAAVIAYQITRPKRPALMRVGGIVSILLTLGIAGWSFMHGAH